jgi:hypothetical protein
MIRPVLNRLICGIVFSAVAVAGAWTAVEAVARIAGRDGHLLPFDYPARWDELASWNPSDLAAAGLWLAMIIGGVLLLLLGAGRTRGSRTVVIDPSSQGDVALRTRGIGSLMRSRLDTEPWLSRSHARVRVRGRRVEVSDRPITSRPWHDDELGSARGRVAAEIERIGLEPGRLRIDPRAPSGRI